MHGAENLVEKLPHVGAYVALSFLGTDVSLVRIILDDVPCNKEFCISSIQYFICTNGQRS